MDFKPFYKLKWSILLVLFTLSLNAQPNKSVAKKPTCTDILLVNGFKDGDTIAKQDISKLKTLSVYNCCNKTFSNKIVAYLFTLISYPSNTTLAGFGPPLTSRMTDALKNILPGNKIFFDLVKLKNGTALKEIRGITLIVGSTRSSLPININTSAKTPSCAPVLLIGKFKAGATITKNELNLIDRLSAYNSCNGGRKYNGCSYDAWYKITSFDISATVNKKKLSIQNTSDEFPKEIKEHFKNLNDSAKIFISHVKAKYNDGSELVLPDVILNIVPSSKSSYEKSPVKTLKKSINSTTKDF